MKHRAPRQKKGPAKGQETANRRWGADEVLRLLAAFYFLALPFVFDPGSADVFRLPKYLFSAISIAVMGAICLVSRKTLLRWRLGSWEFLLGAMLAYAGVMVFFSRHPAVSLEAFYALCYFAALLLILKEIVTPAYLRLLWLGIGAVGALSACFTVLQYLGLFPAMYGADGQPISGRLNPSGLIGEVQSGAMLFGLSCLMLLGWVMAQSRSAWRWTALALIALNGLGLVFTRTLTALAALMVTLLLWLVFHHWWHFRSGKPLTRELKVLWALLAAGLALGVGAAHQAGLIDRIQTVAAQMQRGNWSVATAGRQPVYRITWEMIQERPFLGTGLNTFGVDFFRYRTETEVGRQQTLLDQPGAFRQVHNDYLQVWLELGLPGLILFLALLLIPLWQALGQIRSSQDRRQAYWTALHCLAVVFILVECLTFFPFQLAMSGALIVLVFAGLRAGQSEERLPREGKLPVASWLIKSALAAVVAIMLVYSQVQVWRANERMGMAQQLLLAAYNQQSGNLRLQRGAARRALDYAERAQQLCPRCYQTYDLRGSALMLLGRYREAVEAYSLAVSVIPAAEIYTNLGIAYLQDRNPEMARQSIETALRYRPQYRQALQAMEFLENRP